MKEAFTEVTDLTQFPKQGHWFPLNMSSMHGLLVSFLSQQKFSKEPLCHLLKFADTLKSYSQTKRQMTEKWFLIQKA